MKTTILEFLKESVGYRINLSDLPDSVISDICDNVFDNSQYLQDTFYTVNEFREWVTDFDESELSVISADTTLESLSIGNHVTDPFQVERLKNILDAGRELDPILLNGGKFYDGGHRLTAYQLSGRKTIPTIDIHNLLTLDWKKFDTES